jgi:ABC-type multidrug transport system fused ATPase/permease subunit
VRSGDLTVGQLTTVNSYIVMAVWPLRFTAGAVAGASRAKLALRRMTRLEGSAAEPGPVVGRLSGDRVRLEGSVVEPGSVVGRLSGDRVRLEGSVAEPGPVAGRPPGGPIRSRWRRDRHSTDGRPVWAPAAPSARPRGAGGPTDQRWGWAEAVPETVGPAGPPAIELRQVDFAYRPGRPILERAEAVIAPGEVVALTGATGVGKSTVLRLIAGDLAPDGGQVLVAGVPIARLSAAGRGDRVSLVAEDEFLFDRSLADNLRLARPRAEEAQLRSAASLAVLDVVVDELPEGFGTRLGERGRRLSAGQRQRAALARGLLAPARALALDDVTSALDAATTAAFARLIRQIRADRTVVLVTSEPRLLAAADRVLELADGRLTAWERAPGGRP